MFEITELTPALRAALQEEFDGPWDLYDRIAALPGDVIIKAAGNMAWPMGPRTERLAREVESIAKESGLPFERVAGLGADPYTMIGAGARRDIPVLVSIPQLVGGGAVGLAIGDTISITRRAQMVAETLAMADVIVESAIALSQEIHDGPYETYTGHGIWSAWEHEFSYSLRGKTLVRIDLDPNLEHAWRQERQSSQVQQAVDRGLPKTKLTGIPFRMEMSGFARLEGSLPITADIGIAWPVLAAKVAGKLGIELDFLSAPQETCEGQEMRALDQRKCAAARPGSHARIDARAPRHVRRFDDIQRLRECERDAAENRPQSELQVVRSRHALVLRVLQLRGPAGDLLDFPASPANAASR